MVATFPEAHEVRIVSEAPLPTRFGTFRCVAFVDAAGVEHVALVSGQVADEGVIVRVHSECLTGEAFGSLKCDCGAQLDHALERIAREGGIVVYLRGHEGRAIGLANKIAAYALQAGGADTVDANRLLGLPDDARRYDAAAAILERLGVRSVRLLTNNPAKVRAMEDLGITVVERLPSVVDVGALSAAYLATKRDRMHHALPPDASTWSK